MPYPLNRSMRRRPPRDLPRGPSMLSSPPTQPRTTTTRWPSWRSDGAVGARTLISRSTLSASPPRQPGFAQPVRIRQHLRLARPQVWACAVARLAGSSAAPPLTFPDRRQCRPVRRRRPGDVGPTCRTVVDLTKANIEACKTSGREGSGANRIDGLRTHWEVPNIGHAPVKDLPSSMRSLSPSVRKLRGVQAPWHWPFPRPRTLPGAHTSPQTTTTRAPR